MTRVFSPIKRRVDRSGGAGTSRNGDDAEVALGLPAAGFVVALGLDGLWEQAVKNEKAKTRTRTIAAEEFKNGATMQLGAVPS